jgi:DNA invertase Pin-like site-specific DNA recombinase
MIAAIYARKSTEQSGVSDDVKSVTRQVETATAYAARKGWTVSQEHIYVDDATSGAEWQARHAFNRMITTLDPRPAFQVLIVSELSRIGRDSVRTPYVIQQIEDAGVEIWSYLSDQRISLDDESSEIHTIFNSLAASYERRQARKRTHDAMKRKAECGLVTGGRLYGYDNVRTPEGVKRVVNPRQAEVIRRIFSLYAEGAGLGTIADRLNRDAVPGPRGRTWAFTALREMIRNETYRGVIVWNRLEKIARRGKAKVRRLRPKNEWKRIEVAALRVVDEDLWQRVQSRIEENGQVYARGAGGKLIARPAHSDYDSPYLLSGFVRCGVCNGPVIVSQQSSGSSRKAFLRCANRWKRGTSVCSNKMTVRAELLDRGVLDALADLLDERVIAAAVERALTHSVRTTVSIGQQSRRNCSRSAPANATWLKPWPVVTRRTP